MSIFSTEIERSRIERSRDSLSRRDILIGGAGLLTAGALLLIGGCAAREIASTSDTFEKGNTPMTPTTPQGFDPAPVVPLTSQPPARLIVDSPLPAQLANGLVVVRYRTENLRIMPVYGPGALDVSPRLGHLHITLDDAPWHWVDASGEPLIIQWLPAGPHKLLVELADPTHKVIDSTIINFEISQRTTTRH